MAIPTQFSSSSLVICCLLLIIFLCTINPSVLAARRLESGNGDFFGDQKDDQGKSGVRPSRSRPAGSASGNHSSSGGTVQMPPPTPVPNVTYQGSPGNQIVQVSSPGHQYVHATSKNEPNKNSTNQHVSVTCSSTITGPQECHHYP